jgi:hypothetical protein
MNPHSPSRTQRSRCRPLRLGVDLLHGGFGEAAITLCGDGRLLRAAMNTAPSFKGGGARTSRRSGVSPLSSSLGTRVCPRFPDPPFSSTFMVFPDLHLSNLPHRARSRRGWTIIRSPNAQCGNKTPPARLSPRGSPRRRWVPGGRKTRRGIRRGRLRIGMFATVNLSHNPGTGPAHRGPSVATWAAT